MSTIEVVLQLLPSLNHVELCTAMKAGADLLSKSAKSIVPKASRATGVCPPQLMQNKVWVEAVYAFHTENGWDAFEAKDGDGIIEMEASVPTEAGPRFSDGSELNMKQAMSLAKQLKATNSEFWVAFSESYAEDQPAEKAASAAVTPVRRTRAEISAAAAEKKRLVEEEKAAKALQRAEEKRVRDEAKAAEKAAKEEAKAAAAAAKAEKSAEKSEKLPASSAAATRVAALLAKIKPVAETASEPAVAATAAAAAPAKSSMSQKWVPPADGEWKNFPFKGKSYLANNQYSVYTKTATKGELGNWVGQYIPAEDRIDDEAEEPAYE